MLRYMENLVNRKHVTLPFQKGFANPFATSQMLLDSFLIFLTSLQPPLNDPLLVLFSMLRLIGSRALRADGERPENIFFFSFSKIYYQLSKQ